MLRVPRLRALRALRYVSALVPDLSAVLCPPYDIIAPSGESAFLERDPHNAVRLELPQPEPGGDPDSRYRSAARALADWRSNGVLKKDRLPSVYVHEMAWSDAGGASRRATGFLARLGLETFGPGSGVRPHERTMSGPKEDRLRLLKATGVNLSPVVLLHEAGTDATDDLLARLSDRAPDATATTDDGVSHRLWVCPAESDDPDGGPTGDIGALLRLVGSVPHTIADGHHRYETALRYREERGANRACESDPAWDYVMALMYEVGHAPPVLPTHRVLVAGFRGEELASALDGVVGIERLANRSTVLARMSEGAPFVGEGRTGTGRFGLVSDGVSAILHVDGATLESAQDGATSSASRGLDVNLLAAILERLGIGAAALAEGGAVAYLKDATDAVAMVERGDGAAAFLLDGPPVTAVTRVAAAAELMPQKSTYFHPKAPTGLLFGPLEW
jgi:uncharacterized protein (DUF1015 family)